SGNAEDGGCGFSCGVSGLAGGRGPTAVTTSEGAGMGGATEAEDRLQPNAKATDAQTSANRMAGILSNFPLGLRLFFNSTSIPNPAGLILNDSHNRRSHRVNFAFRHCSEPANKATRVDAP